MKYDRFGRPIWPEYTLPLSGADLDLAIAEYHDLISDVGFECVGCYDDPDAYRPNWAQQRRDELLEWIEASDEARIERKHQTQARVILRNQRRAA